MSNKVILVVLDGLNYQVARDCMGYLNGLLELSDSKNSNHSVSQNQQGTSQIMSTQKISCAPRFILCNVNCHLCHAHCMSAF